jgi:hypothetical protein
VRQQGTIALIVGYLGGLALIGWTAFGPRSAVEVTIDPAEVQLPTFDLPPPAVQAAQNFDEIVNRPLFQASRSAAVDAPVVEVAPVDVLSTGPGGRLDGFRLAAVFRGAESRSAIVELPNGDSLAVREGDRLENWKVVEIRDEKIVLDSRGERRTLDVHDFAYLGEPRVVPRTRALTERAQRAKRRQARSARTTPPVPRQPRRDEEREDDD